MWLQPIEALERLIDILRLAVRLIGYFARPPAGAMEWVAPEVADKERNVDNIGVSPGGEEGAGVGKRGS